eukprot:scaffold9231_cov79-Skeletonema_dohrnii-CCMP3373.AAC.2
MKTKLQLIMLVQYTSIEEKTEKIIFPTERMIQLSKLRQATGWMPAEKVSVSGKHCTPCPYSSVNSKSAATELSKIHPPIPMKLLTFASPLSKSSDVQISSSPSKCIGVLLQKCGIKTVAVFFLTLIIVRIIQYSENLDTQQLNSNITIKTVQSNNLSVADDGGLSLYGHPTQQNIAMTSSTIVHRPSGLGDQALVSFEESLLIL